MDWPTTWCRGAPEAVGRQGQAAHRAVLKVTVKEVFLHCAKALIRARLWEADAQVDRSCFPTYGQVLADQIAGADAAEIDAGEEDSARTELY